MFTCQLLKRYDSQARVFKISRRLSILSKELAISEKLQATDLFDQVRSIITTVEPNASFVDKGELLSLLDSLERRFDDDLARITEASDLLFGEDVTAYGERTEAVFTRWDEKGQGPTLTAMITIALERLGIGNNEPIAKASFIAAVLAEIPNTLQYHGNEHYRKVLFHAIRLIACHNTIYADTPRAFDKKQLGIMLTASCIHDLGHEGGDNLREGVYTPGYMEQRACDIAKPYLEAAGLDEETLGQIETLVFSTDITFFAGDNSPCVRLRRIYSHYFQNSEDDVSLLMMGKLRRYDENPHLVEMAMLLHEADIGSSAGLSYEQTIKETKNIIEERGLKTASPQIVLAFLREQLGETLFTESGKRLFGPVMATVIREAEKDILAGRESYYD